ncbi:hypothetical protein N7540_000087 [Penicillium herquei]|nr:hypothetical protein N7540_000087 [Penicillium herquei]
MANVALPISRREWKKQVRQEFGENSPPSLDTVNWTGGSKISHKQFLSMRCVWSKVDPKADFEEDMRNHLGQQLDIARQWLNEFPPFKAYREAVRSGRRSRTWKPEDSATHRRQALSLGIMQIARTRQEQLSSAAKADIDEEMVISCLVSLLDGITVPCPHVDCGWSGKRQHFAANFGSKKLEVFVDGVLETKNKKPKAFLEAKRAALTRSSAPRVCRQEIAEFVAFLKAAESADNVPNSFFIFSQADKQYYVMVLSFDDDYKEYIRAGTVPPAAGTSGFLEVKKHGPYSMARDKSNTAFTHIALAIAIRSCA